MMLFILACTLDKIACVFLFLSQCRSLWCSGNMPAWCTLVLLSFHLVNFRNRWAFPSSFFLVILHLSSFLILLLLTSAKNRDPFNHIPSKGSHTIQGFLIIHVYKETAAQRGKKRHQMDMKIFEMLPHSSCAVILSDIFNILHLHNTFQVGIL